MGSVAHEASGPRITNQNQDCNNCNNLVLGGGREAGKTSLMAECDLEDPSLLSEGELMRERAWEVGLSPGIYRLLSTHPLSRGHLDLVGPQSCF